MFSEVVRYLTTGVLSVALNTLIIVALTRGGGLHYLVSIAVCLLVVTGVSFVLNRRWTFGKRGGRQVRDLGRYFAVVFATLAVSLGLSFLMVEYCGMPYALATAALSMIFAPLNFLVHRQWSFALPWVVRK